jgi:hypothetical protein
LTAIAHEPNAQESTYNATPAAMIHDGTCDHPKRTASRPATTEVASPSGK